MREILFRGKRIDNSEWVEGFYVFDECTLIVENLSYSLIDNKKCQLFGVHPVIQETVGQYTGLTDKNGKKIFEGDIVKNDIGIKTSVEFFKGRYYPFIAFPEYRCWDEEECEVIGNIHDNPELLKKRG